MKSLKKIIVLGFLMCFLSASMVVTYAEEGETSYEHNLKLGQFHMMEGEFDVAISYFISAIEEKPDYYEAYMELSNTLLYGQRFEELIQVTSDMVEKFPWSSDAYKLRAQGYNAYGEYVLSKKDLQTALKLDPKNHSVHMVMGNTYRLMGEYEKAVEAYTNALKEPSIREQTYILLGEAYELNKDYQMAMQNFEKSLDMNPNSYMANLKIGYINSITGDYDGAIDFYSKAAKIQPSIDVYIQIGAIQLVKGQPQQAVISFERALALDNLDVETIHNIAATFREYEEYNLAAKYLDKGLAVDPNNVDLLNEYGVLMLRQELYTEGLEYFNAANAIDGEDPVVIANIGTAYEKLGDKDKALEYMTKALSLEPSYTYPMMRMKVMAIDQDSTKDFETLLGQMVIESKDTQVLYEYLISALIETEQFDLAKTYGIESCTKAKDYIHALNIGSIFEASGRDEEAKYFYDLSKTYASYSADELKNIAYRLSTEGKFRQRIQAETHALEMEPENTELMFNIGYLRYHLKDFDKAYAMFEHINETTGGHYYAYQMMAKVNIAEKEYMLALEDLKSAKVLNPDLGLEMIYLHSAGQENNWTFRITGEGLSEEEKESLLISFSLLAAGEKYSKAELYDSAMECYLMAVVYGNDKAISTVYKTAILQHGSDMVLPMVEEIMQDSEMDAYHESLGTIYEVLADDYYYDGYYEEAAQAYKMFLEYDSENIDVYNRMGYIYQHKIMDNAQAEYYYLRAIEVAPEVPYAYAGLAWIYEESDRLDEAMELLNKSFELDEEFSYGYKVKAFVHEALGEYEKAEDSSRMAYEFEPSGQQYSHIGYYQFLNGKREMALDTFEKGLETYSDNYSFQCNYALVLSMNGDVDMALNHLEEALKLKDDEDSREWFEDNEDFKNIASDSRFTALLDKYFN